MLVSVVIPVHNAAETILPVLDEAVRVLGAAMPGDVEFIVVDDASTDGTGATLRAARPDHRMVRVLLHDRRTGRSGALRTGARAARGTWIAVFDDGRSRPAEIPRLLAVATGAGDGAAFTDSGCGVALVRRDIFMELPFFDGMHRHLPALVRFQGLGGAPNHGRLGRGLVGIADRLGLFWLQHRTRLPGRVVEDHIVEVRVD